MNLEYDKVSDALLSALPELQERYKRELSWWQGPEPPGQYIVFGSVVKPALRDLLVSNRDLSLLKRVFDFFEKMASSPDIQVPNLLQVEIFEWLVGEPIKLAAAWKLAGPETKRIARDTARIRRCERNLPNE